MPDIYTVIEICESLWRLIASKPVIGIAFWLIGLFTPGLTRIVSLKTEQMWNNRQDKKRFQNLRKECPVIIPMMCNFYLPQNGEKPVLIGSKTFFLLPKTGPQNIPPMKSFSLTLSNEEYELTRREVMHLKNENLVNCPDTFNGEQFEPRPELIDMLGRFGNKP